MFAVNMVLLSIIIPSECSEIPDARSQYWARLFLAKVNPQIHYKSWISVMTAGIKIALLNN